jgi:hypothetical protein
MYVYLKIINLGLCLYKNNNALIGVSNYLHQVQSLEWTIALNLI